ncbi:MAG TPA: M23 family metallopeptidase [Sandaracinaceae bacterium]
MPVILGLRSLLTSVVLLCADPVSSPAPEAPQAAVEPTLASSLALVLDEDEPAFEVVASSPLPAGYRVGSHYGYRTSRRTGARTFHAGIDFLAPRGTPVYAVRGGIVEAVARNRRHTNFAGYGNAIVIHHPDQNRWSFYAHLDDVTVEEGQIVEPGQLIGHVGNTTNGRFPGMGAHLHFEVRRPAPNGESPFPGVYRRYNVDPEDWLAAMGVRFEHEDGEGCAVHGPGELDENAPVLTARPIERAPIVVARIDAAATF